MRIPLRGKTYDPEVTSHRHMGRLYTTSEEYYRKVVTSLPLDPDDPRGEAIVDAGTHTNICERLARGGSYAVSFNTPDDYLYVDNWSIDGACLYHRHPELRVMGTKNIIEVHLEWDVLDNRCSMCDKQISGEIWMMWKLSQL